MAGGVSSSPIWEHGGDLGLHPSCLRPPTPCCVALEGVLCLSVLLGMVPRLQFHPADHSGIQTAHGGDLRGNCPHPYKGPWRRLDAYRSQHLETLLQVTEETRHRGMMAKLTSVTETLVRISVWEPPGCATLDKSLSFPHQDDEITDTYLLEGVRPR